MIWLFMLNHASALKYFVTLDLCMFCMLILQGSGGHIRLLKRNEDLNSTHLQGPSNKVKTQHMY